MAAVGLLYVGAILFVNGLFLLGRISPKGAAPLNLFVGCLQVLTPTFLIFTAGGDREVIAGAAGLYLFGFTYLWVGLNNLFGWRGEGLGWFSAFVTGCALAFAAYSGFSVGDWPSAVLWLQWAALWALFFLLLGLGKTSLGGRSSAGEVGLAQITGTVCLIQGLITGAIPGLLMLFGLWENNAVTLTAVAVTGAANLLFAAPLSRWLVAAAPAERG
ncbi:MAG: transporter [Promicromonosporaceae bacterium]|nr:transporter [Promicromonosporaceae bacterium]